MKKPRVMNRILIIFVFSLLFLVGCNSIDNPKRIDGIINAVYTNYETEKDFEKSKSYLQSKVNNEEISEFTSLIIEKCLKRGISKQ